MGYLQTLAKALTGDGLVLPAPVRSYLKGQPQPLALDTRERLADWCAGHGYSDEQRQNLHNLIRTLVTRERYLRAVAFGSSRIDLDGADTGPVSDIERETAARGLAAAAARRVKPKAAIQPTLAPPPPFSEPAPVPEPPEPLPETPPDPLAASSAMQALGSAFDAASTRPGRHMPRAPVVEVRKRRPLSREIDVDLQPPKRTDVSTVRPQRTSLPRTLPLSVIREAVERANNRRNAVRMIVAHLGVGRQTAAAAERSAWADDAVRILVGDRHDREVAETQVSALVDDMLTGVVPRTAGS
jgi:sRNA-binding protein